MAVMYFLHDLDRYEGKDSNIDKYTERESEREREIILLYFIIRQCLYSYSVIHKI